MRHSSFDPKTPLRAGTRGSVLALWQTRFVIERLRQHWPALHCEVETVRSRGDRDQTTPLPGLGGKGLFTAELEEGLRAGRIDFAVHSLKDLPLDDPPGLHIAAILAREEARDVLISRQGLELDELPANAIVGTSSTRRCAQILGRRPDLLVRSIRGNVDTRLRKLDEGQYDAIVLAGAGILRMGLAARVSQWLPVTWFTPAPGQGALAVQCRADDEVVLALLAAIHEPDLARLVQAERGFLAALGGGCSEPVGAFARIEPTSSGQTSPAPIMCLFTWYSTPEGQHAAQSETHIDWSRAAYEEVVASTAAAARSHLGTTLDSHSDNFGVHASMPRVVLTRSTAGARDACRVLLKAGLQPILAPVIEMTPMLSPHELRMAVGDPEPYDWLLFTSANAVRVFHQLWEGGSDKANSVQSVPVVAVGPQTAHTAAELGYSVAFVPKTYSAEGLLDAIRRGKLGNKQAARVLLPRSAEGQPELVAALEAMGMAVNEIALYQPDPRGLDACTVRALAEGVEVVTFASGSAARAFQAEIARHETLRGLLETSKIVCIGPQTAAAAARLGIHVARVSDIHTMQGMLRAVMDELSHV